MKNSSGFQGPWLFDVNVLLALVERNHINHEVIHNWLRLHHGEAWATCPITENGFLRLMTQPSYPHAVSMHAAFESLLDLKQQHRIFWSEDISIANAELFHHKHFTGNKQITDIYLLALAKKHNARLVTFDHTVAWQAIVGATADLVENPLHQPTKTKP